jgi:hypothetical protein
MDPKECGVFIEDVVHPGGDFIGLHPGLGGWHPFGAGKVAFKTDFV